VWRNGPDGRYLVAINHTDKPLEMPASGTELLTGDQCSGQISVPAGEVRVVRS
jgi:beta-galactosidase